MVDFALHDLTWSHCRYRCLRVRAGYCCIRRHSRRGSSHFHWSELRENFPSRTIAGTLTSPVEFMNDHLRCWTWAIFWTWAVQVEYLLHVQNLLSDHKSGLLRSKESMEQKNEDIRSRFLCQRDALLQTRYELKQTKKVSFSEISLHSRLLL